MCLQNLMIMQLDMFMYKTTKSLKTKIETDAAYYPKSNSIFLTSIQTCF